MTIGRKHTQRSNPQVRSTSLEGEEALNLYVAEIGQRIDALAQQIGRLQAAFAEGSNCFVKLADAQRAAADEFSPGLSPTARALFLESA